MTPLAVLLTACLSVLLVRPAAAQSDDWRTIEFETSEVTLADVALSPDGQTLIFTMLGHLFRLPVTGGSAEQLTFGPYYDTDHAISPDGSRVAFVSDRDGSEGNVFVLELASGKITQVTHESWAGRPTWTPDGQEIVYLSYVFEAAPRRDGFAARYHYWLGKRSAPSIVRRISLSGEEPESVSAPLRLFRSVFYMPDGRLAWTVIESGTRPRRWTTRIEVMSAQGTVSTLRSVEGFDNRIVASPTGDGFYFRRFIPLAWFFTRLDELLYLPISADTERQIVHVSDAWSGIPRFAVSADNKTLYLSDAGRLWRIALSDGFREPIAFRARVRLEIQDPVVSPKAVISQPGSYAPPRSVVDPRLSPDGRLLVFLAAGDLWQQPLDGRPAQRLSEGRGDFWDRDHPAVSPDGRQVAFLRDDHRKVSVYDFDTRQTRTVASGDDFHSDLSWSADGQQLVFTDRNEDDTNRVVAANLSDGTKKVLADDLHGSAGRVHLSADGQSLYFTANITGRRTLYRLPLQPKSKPEPLTQLTGYLRRWRVSPDGKWVAFRRNMEIWITPVGSAPIEDKDVLRQLSPEGGRTFAFAPDGSALIYSAGNRVWRHPLAGGEREEIPIRLELPRPTPPALLVRRVRVLDLSAGVFGPETSLFVEQGRIHRIGSERGQRLPQGTVIVDAGGRFGIPGLFDMHVHGGSPAVYLAYGITSVYNTGGSRSLAQQIALADRGETTREPVPRYFLSGDLFRSGSPDFGSVRHLMIENESDARSYVRRWKERGVHFIRNHTMVWPSARALVEEARRLGLPVVGHGDRLEKITKSVTLGYTGVFQARSRFYDDVLQMLAAAGTRWTPTLAQNGGNWLLLRDEPERLADEKFRVFTGERRVRTGFFHFTVVSDSALRRKWIELLAGIGAAHQRGVRLLAGSGGPAGEIFSGTSLHWELEYLVDAGLAPVEVLRIATQAAAAAVGADDDLGTLEVGKLADIVLLDANPLEDIKNTQTIWRVIKGGWVFDPEELRPERN